MRTRELTFADAPDLLAWAQDPAGGRFFQGDRDSLTPADMERFVLSSLLTQEDLHRAVVDPADRLVGLVSLKQIGDPPGLAEFSIGLLPAAQGRGWAREAAEEILALAFGPLRLAGIYMYTAGDNLATQAFNRRCGFLPLPGPPPGVRRQTAATDRWYGLTRREYLDRRKGQPR